MQRRHNQTRDSNLVSSELHEIEYVVDQFAKEYPQLDRAELRRIVLETKQEIEPSESRERLTLAVRDRLSEV